MLWFEGSIPDAIGSAKQRGSVFVVVITGEDEQSNQLMASWEDERVSEAASSCCVTIKVNANSQACEQFSQIYPVVCVPSSFFIGENGIPLEVIAGNVSAEELTKRIHHVKQMHAQQMGPETRAPVQPCDATESEPTPEPAPEPHSEKAQDPVPGPSGAAETVAPDEKKTSQSADEENLEAKVERLTKKLEERREQKKIGEEESEIRREVERRKVGKDIQDFRKKQEEEKTKRLLEERNREKAEQRAARERVKQQIALDRAERAARYAKVQEEERAAKQAQQQLRQAEQEAKKEAELRDRSGVARIQFRLPDGSSFTNVFPSQSRLQEALHFAAQEVGNRYGNFSMATMFPRREFTSDDLEKTLLELQLAPSAAIVLLPQSSRPPLAIAQSSGGIWALLGTLLYPLLAVWRFLSSFLFVAPPPPGAESRGSTHQQPRNSTHQPPNTYSKPTDKTNRDSAPLEKRPKDFKKDGKICRLRTQEDSEDDNNTWNGNSTQQM